MNSTRLASHSSTAVHELLRFHSAAAPILTLFLFPQIYSKRSIGDCIDFSANFSLSHINIFSATHFAYSATYQPFIKVITSQTRRLCPVTRTQASPSCHVATNRTLPSREVALVTNAPNRVRARTYLPTCSTYKYKLKLD